MGHLLLCNTSVIYQNNIHNEIQGRILPGNACYHSVKNPTSRFLSYKVQLKIYINIFPCYFVKVKVKFSLEQAMKAQRGSRGIALLFL
jgi:hypothetical protein